MTGLAPHVAWKSPDWLQDAYAWIDARVAGLGLERVHAPEQIHAYPWATVLRVPTSGEQLFFKAMMPLLAHEASAISVLAGFRPALVTDVAAWDPETGWMLMRDAGVPIRDVSDERIEDWEWVQQEYARLSEEYAGRWIAVSGRRVVGASPRLATAVRQARKAGVEHPFVTAFKAAKYRRTLEVAHWL